MTNYNEFRFVCREKKKYKHQFANVLFICSITALQAITIVFPINTFRKPLKIMQDHSRTIFWHPVIAVFVYSPIRVTSKSVGKRFYNVPPAVN